MKKLSSSKIDKFRSERDFLKKELYALKKENSLLKQALVRDDKKRQRNRRAEEIEKQLKKAEVNVISIDKLKAQFYRNRTLEDTLAFQKKQVQEAYDIYTRLVSKMQRTEKELQEAEQLCLELLSLYKQRKLPKKLFHVKQEDAVRYVYTEFQCLERIAKTAWIKFLKRIGRGK